MTQRRAKDIEKKGFTLVELMIVIAIIGLIAAVSVSSMVRARVQANEGGVRQGLKTVQSATVSYRGAMGAYPTSLSQLGSDYLGGGLESGTKSGYNFILVGGSSGESYTLTAVPVNAGFTGTNGFCTDVYNVIYVYTDPTGLSGDGVSSDLGVMIA